MVVQENCFMKLHTENTLHWFPLMIGYLLLMLLLSACGSSVDGNHGASATPTSQSIPSSLATLPLPTPAPATSFTSYSGDGFTIDYPQDWTKRKSTAAVIFTETNRAASFAIQFVLTPHGSQPAETLVQASIDILRARGKNLRPAHTAPMTMVGGESWRQSAVTEDVIKDGQPVNVVFVFLANTHPAKAVSTRTFLILYSTRTQFFDKAEESAFQLMLGSFKFT
jgi:hypothetical protein